MRCGQSGCSCTTCQECYEDYPCKCPKRKTYQELKTRVDAWEVAGEDASARGFLAEAMELLNDYLY